MMNELSKIMVAPALNLKNPEQDGIKAIGNCKCGAFNKEFEQSSL